MHISSAVDRFFLALPYIGWLTRFYLYKIRGAKLLGSGYVGKPLLIIGISRIKAGQGLGIFPGARMEVGKQSTLEFGKNVRIGHGIFIDSSTGSVSIGNDVVISANVFIGSAYVDMSKGLAEIGYKDRYPIAKDVVIEDSVFIGYGAVILPGSYISRGSVIGANSVVRGFVPESSILYAPLSSIKNS